LEGFSYNADDSYGASLTWTIPLFDVSTRQKIRQRLLERKRLELDIANVKSGLNVRLQSVLRQIRLSTEEVETARISRKLAEEQLKNEIERFKVGGSTSFQVSQFQQNASEAKVREILAQVKFERNFLAMLVLTGDLFETYGMDPSHQ
jgi:outer membrane protein TolC